MLYYLVDYLIFVVKRLFFASVKNTINLNLYPPFTSANVLKTQTCTEGFKIDDPNAIVKFYDTGHFTR